MRETREMTAQLLKAIDGFSAQHAAPPKEDYTCCICMSLLDQATTLCARENHLACVECVNDLLKHHPEAAKCPLCRGDAASGGRPKPEIDETIKQHWPHEYYPRRHERELKEQADKFMHVYERFKFYEREYGKFKARDERCKARERNLKEQERRYQEAVNRDVKKAFEREFEFHNRAHREHMRKEAILEKRIADLTAELQAARAAAQPLGNANDPGVAAAAEELFEGGPPPGMFLNISESRFPDLETRCAWSDVCAQHGIATRRTLTKLVTHVLVPDDFDMSVRARAQLNARGVTVLSVTELRALLRLRSNPNRRPRDDSDSNDEQRNQRPRLTDQELDNVLVEHQVDEAMAPLRWLGSD
jgi:hypothetical protein